MRMFTFTTEPAGRGNSDTADHSSRLRVHRIRKVRYALFDAQTSLGTAQIRTLATVRCPR
jgi:hypothetical protein